MTDISPEKNRLIEAVVFDMDGLLLDSEVIARDTFVETCHDFELEPDVDLFMRCVGVNAEGAARILAHGLGDRVDSEAFDRTWDRKYTRSATGGPIPLKAGVRELLEQINRADLPMAVATSSKTGDARDRLELTGLLGAFALIVGGDQVERSKPDPQIFLKAAAGLRVAPEKCLVLEDSENGVKAAVGAGMTVIQVPDLVPPSPELKQLGHRIVHSLLVLRRISQRNYHEGCSGRQRASSTRRDGLWDSTQR